MKCENENLKLSQLKVIPQSKKSQLWNNSIQIILEQINFFFSESKIN